ncbi:hypothetical protein ABC304_03580 [Microbacterium sp. 1P10UB]|uniref:hypothetical protein n=1 Tax=unclassified Microbacterium TaxID=2609290 RepID=UPI0039A31C09
MTEPQPTVHDVDAHVQQVAVLLPFPVRLDADMGGTFAMQIDLGRRGGVDDPHDTAGIDPADPRWWVDIEGGERTYISDFGLDADPQAVANWLSTTAQQQQCPAAVDADIRRRNAIVTASHPTHTNQATDMAAAPSSTPNPEQRPGHER